MIELENLQHLIQKELKVWIKQKTRKREVIDARFIFCELAKEDFNKKQIGEFLGLDRTSINHAHKAFNNLMAVDKPFQKKFKLISEKYGVILNSSITWNKDFNKHVPFIALLGSDYNVLHKT